ncbi:hypothetical protein ACFYL6_20740 [Micromonospora sp. NPDC007208]|uniref:hypothetical protein n=1 Tax=Micromonospora sp. NPDC007208 TaxID=3364236 RepID=UPI003688E7D0
MSYDLRDGTVHAWATAPHRITTLQYLRASIAQTLGLEPDHHGADPDWAQQLRDMRTADDHAVIQRARGRATVPQPRVALAAVPYRLVDVPHLGELPIGPLEPAHIHNQLIGAK